MLCCLQLYNKLNAEELQKFALLIKAWQGPQQPSELSFADFLSSVAELYGAERNYLLVGQSPCNNTVGWVI